MRLLNLVLISFTPQLRIWFRKMKVAIASDHAGYQLKSLIIKKFLKSKKYQFIDFGTDSSDVSVDYPDFAAKVCQEIIASRVDLGVLICGSGVGISIAANRFKQIRAALCSDASIAKLARQHNDANVLCLGSRAIDSDLAIKLVKAFLVTDFEGGRHIARLKKIS